MINIKPNDTLSFKAIYLESNNIFFSKVSSYKEKINLPIDKTKLFLFYEEYIEGIFLDTVANLIDKDEADLLVVMLWSIFRVWSSKVIEENEILEELNDSDKMYVLERFIENLNNDEGIELLTDLGSDLSSLKNQ